MLNQRARQSLAERMLELGFRFESVAAGHGESSCPVYGKGGSGTLYDTKYNGHVAFAPPRKRFRETARSLPRGKAAGTGPERTGSIGE